MIVLIYGIQEKKMIQINLENRDRLRGSLREGTYGYLGEGSGARVDLEFGIDMYTYTYTHIHYVLYLKEITNKGIL